MFENIRNATKCHPDPCFGRTCSNCPYDYSVEEYNRELDLLCNPDALIEELKKHADIGHNGEVYGISFEKLKKIL